MFVQLNVNKIDKQGVREEDSGGVVGVVGVEVRMAGEHVQTGQEAARDMDDFQIEFCKVEQPACLATVEVLCLMEICQVLVIREDLDGEERSIEIMSPGFQGVDDRKEFLVIDVIISFCGDEQLGQIGTGMPITIGVGLEEDGT